MHLCKIGLSVEGRKRKAPTLNMPIAEISIKDADDGDPVLVIAWGKCPVRSLVIRVDDIKTAIMGGAP